MSKQLWKEGKRRCYKCDTIFPLDSKHFRPSRHGARGFVYVCRPCGTLESREAVRRPRMVLFEKHNRRCAHCGLQNESPSFFDVDHIKPTKDRKGARRFASHKPRMREMSNLQLLCPNCHRIKTMKDLNW